MLTSPVSSTQGIKRQYSIPGYARIVNGQVAINADEGTIDDNVDAIEVERERLRAMDPAFRPHCDVNETYTGSVGKQMVGSNAYW